MENLEEIAKEWNALGNDVERWRYVLANNKKIALRLDNDSTYATFCEDIIPDSIEDWDDLPSLKDFDDWVGNSGGLDDLFLVLCVDAQGV